MLKHIAYTSYVDIGMIKSKERTLSSVGRATSLHLEGRRSESYRVHYFAKATKCKNT